MNVIGRHRNVRPDVAAKAGEYLAIVIAPAARVDLHHQPVFHTHPRHFRQHLSAKELMLSDVGLPGDHPVKESRSRGVWKIGCPGGRVPVIGGRAAELFEAFTGVTKSQQITLPTRTILAVHLTQPLHILAEAIEFRVDHRIGSKRRHDTGLPL